MKFILTSIFLFLSVAVPRGLSMMDCVNKEFWFYMLFPGVPFLILAFFTLFSSQRTHSHFCGLGAAAFMTLLSIGFPYLMAFIDLRFFPGGGANIGLGILLLFMPIYVFPVMIFGYLIGKLCTKKFDRKT